MHIRLLFLVISIWTSTQGQNFKRYYEKGACAVRGLEMEGTIINDKWEGYWKFYYPCYVRPNAVEEEGYYSNGDRTGEWKEYYGNGSLKAVGSYTNGEKAGIWKEYYDNGQLRAKGDKKDYERTGKWELYYKNGQLSAVGEYKTDGYPRAGTWTTYDIKGQRDSTNCPEPHSFQIRTLCTLVGQEVSDDDEHSRYNYEYESHILKMACVDVTKSNPEEVKKKVQLWWNKYHDECKCDKADFTLSNGNILKYAFQSSFYEFLISVTEDYKLNLNFIDPKDGKTVLDFAIEEYEEFKKYNLGHPDLKKMEYYIKYLKENGAKRSKEL